MTTLSELQIDVRARIAEIQADPHLLSRLHAVGIVVGSSVQRTRESAVGAPVFISTQHECAFALGYDLASKIFIITE